MGLNEFVSGLPADWKPKMAVYPSQCRMAEVRRAIEARTETRLTLPPLIDLASLKQHLIACRGADDWTGLSAREWRYSSECLALGQPRLVDDPDFIAAYLRALGNRPASSAGLNLLARWYLRNAAPGHDGFQRIGLFLIAHLGRMRPGWSKLHALFALFNPDEAGPGIARAVLDSGRPVQVFLTDTLCPLSVLSSPLFGHGFIAACRTIAEGPPPELDSLRALKAWGFNERGFQYPTLPGALAMLAEAMLRPWASHFPGEAIRSFVVGLLLGVMNDPRTNPAAWAAVSVPAQKVMLAWMIKDSLEQFLQVVDETVKSHQSRMWANRRQFWLSYYEGGYISECWVVFGRRGAALARQLALETQNPALENFGVFIRDVGRDPTQAVLLMRVGDLRIADWSHNAHCCIWRPDNQSAPKLYQNEYLQDELLSGADYETPHHKDWQNGVREYIAGQLGLAMRMMGDDIVQGASRGGG
ncbi:Zorya protein ZorC EH domain-containing protein [Azospirillaceae bacterium]|nr:hypothetical protein MTCCP1_00002 [uncultured bacterium]